MHRLLWFATSFAAGLCLCSSGEAADERLASALVSSLSRNTDHARNWLAARDFKSLTQTAGGMELLAELLQSQSSDQAWQAAAGRVATGARAIRTAAQSDDAAAATEALAKLTDASAVLASLTPTGQPLPPPKANLRSLMLLMDGVRGEAKIALITGNAEKAKNQAYVLSELGRVVSNLRSGERWAGLSAEFTAASLAAARSPSTDVNELRPLLKIVSQRCDACHDTR